MDWGRCLPSGVLSLVAGGRNELKVMREVCHNWQHGFEDSVSKITSGEGPPLPSAEALTSRFPGLTSLLLWKHKMGQDSLGNFSGLRKVAKLTLLSMPEVEFVAYPQHQSPLSGWWSDLDVEAFKGMPALRDLTMNSHRVRGLQNLRGANLTCLNLIYCTSLASLEGLDRMPLTSLRLDHAPLLDDEGLERLRGLPLTELHLCYCPRVTEGGLEVLKGMPLKHLRLDHCGRLERAACAEMLEGLPLTELDLTGCCVGVLDICLEVSKFLPCIRVSVHADAIAKY